MWSSGGCPVNTRCCVLAAIRPLTAGEIQALRKGGLDYFQIIDFVIISKFAMQHKKQLTRGRTLHNLHALTLDVVSAASRL